jgi:uncharacterized Fe-S cluster-containing radical SAM superfamily protein
MMTLIDTDALSTRFRERSIERHSRSVRITSLEGSEQATDLTEPLNCRGLGRVRHFRARTSQGWPSNPLPIAPACRALGLNEAHELRAQVFQLSTCNWRCWYCFVDFKLLSGSRHHSELISVAELVDLYLALRDEAPAILDLSGGQPDLVPEWIAWTVAELRRRGSPAYVWSDDNLSNDYFFRYLTSTERRTLELDNSYGKVGCFKGFDAHSFTFNTWAPPELFDRQFALMGKYIRETGLDVYAYVTLTSDDGAEVDTRVGRFVDRLQEIAPNLPLRTVPLEIAIYAPVHSRMDRDRYRSLAIQQEAVAAWNSELKQRFSPDERSASICDVDLRG